MAHTNTLTFDLALLGRVRGEYLEMPGLQLTVAQACRLWNADVAAVSGVLDALVAAAFLRRSGPRYVRADGTASRVRPGNLLQ